MKCWGKASLKIRNRGKYAAVKSIKTLLGRSLPNTNFISEQRATHLAKVETILNSRSIGSLTDDPNDLQPLTPGHFLIGYSVNLKKIS